MNPNERKGSSQVPEIERQLQLEREAYKRLPEGPQKLTEQLGRGDWDWYFNSCR